MPAPNDRTRFLAASIADLGLLHGLDLREDPLKRIISRMELS